MKLSEALIDLTGYFKSSIENNHFFCSGLCLKLPNLDTDQAQVYQLNCFNEVSKTTTEVVMVIFRQNGELVTFGYKTLVFYVRGVEHGKITLFRDGQNYFIEPADIPI